MKEIAYRSVRGGYFGAVTLMGILAFLRVAIMIKHAATWLDWLDIATMALAVILIYVSFFRHSRALDRLSTNFENKALLNLSAYAYFMAFFAYLLLFVAAHALH